MQCMPGAHLQEGSVLVSREVYRLLYFHTSLMVIGMVSRICVGMLAEGTGERCTSLPSSARLGSSVGARSD